MARASIPRLGRPKAGRSRPASPMSLCTLPWTDGLLKECTHAVGEKHGGADRRLTGGGAFRWQADAERFVRVRPNRWAQCNRQGAPETTHLGRFSRLHPSTKRRFTWLGFAFCWTPDRHGVPRVLRRTARKKLHAACQRLTAWLKQHRHLPGRAVFQRLHARLRGHDNSYGVRGHARARNRFFHGAMAWTFQWLNRRGGKQRRYTWEQCTPVLDRVKIARPRMTEVPRRRVVA